MVVGSRGPDFGFETEPTRNLLEPKLSVLASRVLAGCSLASAGCHTEEHANGSQRRSPTLRSMWPAPTSSSRAMDDRTELPEESDTAITTLPEVRSASSTETTEVSLSIAGMTCGACAALIQRRLNALDGVEATVNYATERARVFLPMSTTADTLVDAVESAGYSAEILGDGGVADGSDEDDQRVHFLGRRLLVSALLFMPLCDLSLIFSLIPVTRFPHWQWLMVVLAAPVLTWAAWPFYRAAFRAARHGTSTMDTLVSLGILAATGWSLYAMFWQDTSRSEEPAVDVIFRHAGGAIYLDVAAGVTTFLLAGRYFEAWSRRRTGNALRSLAEVGAKDVAVIDESGTERRVPIGTLSVGDRFVVRPGETVATDGEVIDGAAGIDRSVMTGESLPLDVVIGDKVIGGTVAVGGRLIVQATNVGADTQLAHMLRLVEDAQNEKAAVQRLADRIAGYFVPAVLTVSALTLAVWLLAGGSKQEAFERGALCPHHRLSLRSRTGHTYRAARRHRAWCRTRDLLQGLPGP